MLPQWTNFKENSAGMSLELLLSLAWKKNHKCGVVNICEDQKKRWVVYNVYDLICSNNDFESPYRK